MASIDYDVLGVSWSKVHYMNTTMTLVSAGIQLFMCLYGLSAFFETPQEHRKGRLPYITVSFIIFILYTFSGSLDAYHTHELLFGAKSGTDFMVLYSETRNSWYRYVSSFCMLGFVAAGDGLLLLRCYIIWRDRWWICVVPAMTYLTSIALGIYAFSASRETNQFATAWTFTTVIVNILATCIIAFRLIRAKRSLRAAMPNRKVKVFTDVITMLIESAAPPTIFGIIVAALNNLPGGTTTGSLVALYGASYTFSLLYFSFVALSPQMIIFRVTTGRSWARPFDTAPDSNQPLSNPLVFARSRGIEQSFFDPVVSTCEPKPIDEKREDTESDV